MKNVILLTIDTLRRDVIGCYGGKGGLTPFIDSIQDRCIRFNNALSTGPYTQAAFPGILTSSYYLEYGPKIPRNLPKERVLISEVLKKHGILSAGFHSNAYLCSFLAGIGVGIPTMIRWMSRLPTKFPILKPRS